MALITVLPVQVTYVGEDIDQQRGMHSIANTHLLVDVVKNGGK